MFLGRYAIRREIAMNMPKQVRFVIVTSIVLCAVCSMYALFEVTDEGAWPKNWPKELEPLRNQSRTLTHQAVNIHEIPFTNRGKFESAWPHILRIKSKEAPLILLSSPYDRLGEPIIKAGVRILSPLTGTLVTPKGTRYPPGAESAIPGGEFLRIGPPWPDYIKSESGALPEYVVSKDGKWAPYSEKEGKERVVRRARIDIELVVDGDIVDLNRIPLPADTPIIDKRFKKGPNKADAWRRNCLTNRCSWRRGSAVLLMFLGLWWVWVCRTCFGKSPPQLNFTE